MITYNKINAKYLKRNLYFTQTNLYTNSVFDSEIRMDCKK